MPEAKLSKGTLAPTFSLPDKDGNIVFLKDLTGKKVILYFYPAASTPGCTAQACDFQLNMSSLRFHGYEILGILKDAAPALIKFATNENLSFALLSDENLAVHNLYGAYGEKLLDGKVVMGVIRSTFVIDEAGVLTHALYNVKATGHLKSLRTTLGLED